MVAVGQIIFLELLLVSGSEGERYLPRYEVEWDPEWWKTRAIGEYDNACGVLRVPATCSFNYEKAEVKRTFKTTGRVLEIKEEKEYVKYRWQDPSIGCTRQSWRDSYYMVGSEHFKSQPTLEEMWEEKKKKYETPV